MKRSLRKCLESMLISRTFLTSRIIKISEIIRLCLIDILPLSRIADMLFGLAYVQFASLDDLGFECNLSLLLVRVVRFWLSDV